MKRLLKNICIGLGILTGIPSCVNDTTEALEMAGSEASVTFDLEFDSRAGETNADSPLYDYFIDGRSVILISQRGNNLSLDFNDYDVNPDDPSELIPNKNLYKYVYYTNPVATWESGFNFQPYQGYALDWPRIEAGGELSGGYALGALYYPVGYEVMTEVPTDQSAYDNLLKANVLGAFHTTNSSYSRLRFRFYHLMSAIRVTLLIPDWNPDDNTGFGENAAQSAYMLKVKTDYSVTWPLGISSEEYPSPEIPVDAQENSVRMYLESVSNEVETVHLQSLNPDYPAEEKVRKATFLIIFPPQQPTSDGPAMRFYLTTMGGTEKSFVWYTQNIVQGSLSMVRNSLTNLTLYLPRVDNNAILIKSYIAPWTEAESEFTVIPD